jgi:DNA/RNA endonuclease YhcR with UshA esterase domain
MEDRILLTIALVCGCLGVVALFLIAIRMSPNDVELGRIESLKDSESVRVTGEITRIVDRGDVGFLDITSTETAMVVIFSPRNLTLKKGDKVSVTGRISEYQGRNEIIAEKIQKT